MSSNYKIHTTLTRKTSVTLNIPEHIVDQVISFQWREANEAIKTCTSIELSSLGVFKVSQPSVKKKIALYEKYQAAFEKRALSIPEEDPDHYRNAIQLNRITADLAFLRTKIDPS